LILTGEAGKRWQKRVEYERNKEGIPRRAMGRADTSLQRPTDAPMEVPRLPQMIRARPLYIASEKTMADLHEFAKNIWTIEGPDVRDMGLMFTTRMTIVKLTDGSLWVDSPVSLPFDTVKKITELGPIRYLVAGTPRHVWRLDSWHKLFPEAQLWSARPSLFTLKKGTLPSAGVLGANPPQAWENDLDQVAFKGSALIEEIIFFTKGLERSYWTT
jgi:hypothetical protein